MNIKYYICCLLFSSPFYSCSGNNKLDTLTHEAKSIEINVKLIRFDKDFNQYLQNPTLNNQKQIETSYKDFLPAFGRITINNSDSYKPEFYKKLQKYYSNEMLLGIYADALKTFEDVSTYEKELSDADALIYSEMGGKHLPALSIHVSGFKENVMVLDDRISISTDKYLGTDYLAYKRFFEEYQIQQMQQKMIVRDYLKAFILSENWLKEEKKKSLLSEMIKEGKILYILSQLLPNWSKADLIGYSSDEMKWCEDKESDIWKSIVNQNHLYDQNALLITKYTNEAPYTATIASDSPGRVGTWVGFQIVSLYASKNSGSLIDLLTIDSQQILKGSGYNP